MSVEHLMPTDTEPQQRVVLAEPGLPDRLRATHQAVWYTDDDDFLAPVAVPLSWDGGDMARDARLFIGADAPPPGKRRCGYVLNAQGTEMLGDWCEISYDDAC